MTRRIAALAIVLAAGAVLFAFAAVRHPPGWPAERLGPVVIADAGAMAMGLLWLAAERGLFDEAGVEVRMAAVAYGKTAAAALHDGQAHLATMAEFVLLRESREHGDLRILGTLARSGDIRVVARRDRGIATPADLKGRRVAVSMGSTAEFFLSRLLNLHGLGDEDITWIDLAPAPLGDALVEGKVDAAIIWQPHAGKIARRLGEQAVVLDGQPGQDFYFVLIGTAGWLAANGEAARRVMLALRRAEAWAEAHPKPFAAFLEGRTGVRPDPTTRFTVSLSASLITALGEEMRWLRSKGQSRGRCPNDLLELIEAGPLRAADPAAVTMVR